MGKFKRIDVLRQIDDSIINDKKLKRELDKLDDSVDDSFDDSSDVVEIPKTQRRNKEEEMNFNNIFTDSSNEGFDGDYFDEEGGEEDNPNDDDDSYDDDEDDDEDDNFEEEDIYNKINNKENIIKKNINSSSVEEKLFGNKSNAQPTKKDDDFSSNKTYGTPQPSNEGSGDATDLSDSMFKEKKIRKPSVFNGSNSFSEPTQESPKPPKRDLDDFYEDDEEDDDDEGGGKPVSKNEYIEEEEDYSFNTSESDKEEQKLNPNIEALFNKQKTTNEAPTISFNKEKIPDELSFQERPDEKIKSFSDSLKKDRKSTWDRLKQEAEESLSVNLDAKESKKPQREATESTESIEKNVLDDSSSVYINFKKPQQAKIDTNNIHYSLIGFFDKLKFLGFNKKEAILMLSSFDLNTINKLASLFSFLDIRPSLLKNIKAYKSLLSDLQSLNELPNSSLSLFFKNKSVLLNNVSLIKVSSLIKLNKINCGLLESRFFSKINLNSLTNYILKTKKQYSFRGYTVSGLKVCGLAISLQRVEKSTKGRGIVLNVFCKLGTTTLEEDTIYLFLARDSDNNNYVLLMK